MIISISGYPGSGKSTVRGILAMRLGYKEYSIGDLRGKLAIERGLTIDELNALGEIESWTDKDVDEYQRKLGEIEDNFVIDGRTSFYFIPNSFKVFLKVDVEEGARRIMMSHRPDEPFVDSLSKKVEQIKARVESDCRRYMQYYGVDMSDESVFDMVIDTTNQLPDKVADQILDAVKLTTKFLDV